MFQSSLVVVMSEEAVYKCLLGWRYYKKNFNFTRLHTTDFEKISFFFYNFFAFLFHIFDIINKKNLLRDCTIRVYINFTIRERTTV